ncbi:septum formation initiator family protein [Desulfococcus sp.]|uniref:FtsB family cell division protein n=1 Tax=Desulfococcus sp. TaxID=2025834 RepID=UPI003594926E
MLKKTLTIYLPLSVVIVIFLLIFFGDKGLLDLKTMETKKRQLVEKNEALVQSNLSLHQTVVRLKDDLAFIENVARKDLGLIKENEVIVKLEKDPRPGETVSTGEEDDEAMDSGAEDGEAMDKEAEDE